MGNIFRYFVNYPMNETTYLIDTKRLRDLAQVLQSLYRKVSKFI